MHIRICIGLIVLAGTLLTSCDINKNLMFQMPKDAVVKYDSIPLQPTTEYTISKDDKFSFTLHTNNGEQIIQTMSGLKEETQASSSIEYVVRTNGTADLPLLGTVIAQAGGIADRGRADRIKLMRTENGKRTVYQIDLSTIDGLKYADLVVQANDYVYVEPVEQVSKEAVEAVAPVVSLVSSALIIFTVFNNLKE